MRWSWVIAVLVALAATTYALLPLRDLVRQWNDFAFVWTAGRVWLKLGSPYDVRFWRSQWVDVYPSFAGLTFPAPNFPTQPFLYPPHWALVAIPLAALPWAWACRLWDMANVAAYGTILVLLVKLLAAQLPRPQLNPWVWLGIALAAANGAVRWTFWECQMSMVPTLGVVGAYWAWMERRERWMVFFVFIGLWKPQIGVVPLLYLALIGGHRGVVRGALAAFVVGAVAMAHVRWSLLPEQLRECVRLHGEIRYNSIDGFFSFSSLLWRLGRWALLSQLLGVVALVGLVYGQSKLGRGDQRTAIAPLAQLSVACAVCVAFIPLHGYDLVLLTPLFLWAVAFRHHWLAIPMVLLAAVTSRTELFGLEHHLHPLSPWFTLGLVTLCIAAWWTEAKPHRQRIVTGSD